MQRDDLGDNYRHARSVRRHQRFITGTMTPANDTDEPKSERRNSTENFLNCFKDETALERYQLPSRKSSSANSDRTGHCNADHWTPVLLERSSIVTVLSGPTRLFAVAVDVAVSCSAAGAQDAGRTMTPGELQWKSSTRVKGLEQADLIGDSTRPGPYVQRVRYPANFVNPPHSHPEERTYTVISGTWYVGWGPKLDESKLLALPPGSFYTEPANVAHFVLSKGEPVVVQISGVGPTATRLVEPSQAPK